MVQTAESPSDQFHDDPRNRNENEISIELSHSV